jgi:hypothetical protein
MASRVTIDVRRAKRQLYAVSNEMRKTDLRKIARPASNIAKNELRSTHGPVPKYTKGLHHTFSNKSSGYLIQVLAGNLRKSMHTMVMRKSTMLWTGPKYRKTPSGRLVGSTYANADGVYAKLLISKTGNDFIAEAKSRKGAEINRQLRASASVLIKKLMSTGYATP